MRRALALFAATILLLCMIQSPAQAAEPLDQGTLYGIVIGNTSGPMTGVTVTARNTTSDGTFFAVTNETGEYEIRVPFGIYNITASLMNYTSNRTYSNVEVPAVPPGPYNFTMTEVFGSVVGFITDDDGPVYNVNVVLSNEVDIYYATSTQLFGRYEIGGINPGMYVVYAEKRGYNRASYPAPIEVERGEVIEINFTLDAQPALVFGSISTENDRPIVDVKVTLSANDGTLNTFTDTDSDGNYTITGLSAGSYTMTFEKEGYETEVGVFDFNPYESKRVDMTLVKVEKNATTVLFGYDLTHSLMIIGFFTGLVIVLLGVFVNIRSQKRPEMLAQLAKDEDEQEGRT